MDRALSVSHPADSCPPPADRQGAVLGSPRRSRRRRSPAALDSGYRGLHAGAGTASRARPVLFRSYLPRRRTAVRRRRSLFRRRGTALRRDLRPLQVLVVDASRDERRALVPDRDDTRRRQRAGHGGRRRRGSSEHPAADLPAFESLLGGPARGRSGRCPTTRFLSGSRRPCVLRRARGSRRDGSTSGRREPGSRAPPPDTASAPMARPWLTREGRILLVGGGDPPVRFDAGDRSQASAPGSSASSRPWRNRGASSI